jgi:hypothetical protein
MSEVLLHLLIWSLMFEWLGPCYFRRGTADVLDVLAYSAGGIGAWLFWRSAPAATRAPESGQ